jgi:hypothetical protein
VQQDPASPPLEEGTQVRTPSGAIAMLLKIYHDAEDGAEGLVEWFNGERARFKIAHLQAVPPKDPA